MAILGSTIVNGDLTASGKITAVNFYSTSDKALKENIKEVKDVDFKGIIDKIDLKEFNFKYVDDNNLYLGVIAQELKEVIPDEFVDSIIVVDKNGYYSVNESKLVFWLIGALKEEIARNDKLEERIAKIEVLLEK